MKTLNITCKLLMIAAIALLAIFLTINAIVMQSYITLVVNLFFCFALAYGIFQSGRPKL